MKMIRKILRIIAYCLCFPLLYLIIAIICSYIPVNTETATNANYDIYLSTNGIHLEIVMPKKNLSPFLLNNLKHREKERYISFGWGDKNFYANTPTWKDITPAVGLKALFLNTPTLIHVSRYQKFKAHWVSIKVSKDQLQSLNQFIQDSFVIDSTSSLMLKPQPGYWKQDNFYTAKGSYTCFNTCNSWVNRGFKESEIKASLWTPFDFGLLYLHQ
ncbi:TIGR02117 family protein [Aquimarina brevivitae]|uniref:Uncharacterized protein (TIGR02117 family) n=1 Tax=Aquimarina brevivitae TaxID=323412 RepID=A0A4Q7PI81_9FLAO|nr:TIGR02117 family protein [Aquimarina brevivitae]RZS99927.1 uncharacterized protein (TIGR02117 family) [Aquimarina brevivitae]